VFTVGPFLGQSTFRQLLSAIKFLFDHVESIVSELPTNRPGHAAICRGEDDRQLEACGYPSAAGITVAQPVIP